MSACIVDIGGTNIRYSFYSKGKKLRIKKGIIPSKKSFLNILSDTFNESDKPIKDLVISAAGPKYKNTIEMTNQNFKIDSQKIKKKFKLKNCFLLNDLEAAGYSLKNMSSKNNLILKKGNLINKNKVLVCPGTGLGLCLTINDKLVVPSEIGNSKFFTFQILQEYRNIDPSLFNKIEDFISGPGLSRLHKSLYKKDLLPSELINKASRKDPKALKTLDLFFEIFAKFLAEISLVYMPGNGIFISGSLMRNLEKIINKEKFNKNFVEHVEKSHKKVLESFEISLIKQEHLSVHGCKEFFNLTQKGLN